MEEKSLDDIHHLGLVVADLEQSKNWYLTSFSCEVLSETKTEIVLQFNNIRLSLVLPSHQPSHLAFVRDDANTLGELRKQQDGTFSTFISDPTGNAVEIISSDSV